MLGKTYNNACMKSNSSTNKNMLCYKRVVIL